MITTLPPLEYGAMAKYVYSESLQKAATFTSRFDNQEIEIGKREGDFYYIPRAAVPFGGKDTRSLGQNVSLTLQVPPRDAEQARIVRESIYHLTNERNHIICASTGFGKTWVGLAIAAQLGVTTLIIVTKTDLMTQWRERAKQFLGLRDDEIGTLQQDCCDVKGKRIVIGMVHSLAKDKYPAYVKDYFGLILVDEIHRLGADTFSKAAGMFTAKHRLGLSATVKRQDGKDIVFRSHIGEVLVVSKQLPMIPKVIVVKSNFKVPMVTRKVNGDWKKIKLPHTAGKTIGVVKLMAQDKHRNKMILDFVLYAYKKGRNIVVFSDLLGDHLEPLRDRLVTDYGVPIADTGMYVGGMKPAQLDVSASKRVVFATYKMMSEGTDIGWLDCAIMTTPRSDVEQIIGRVLREYPDKPTPIVWDLVDVDSEVFSGYFYKRRKFYYSIKAEILNL